MAHGLQRRLLLATLLPALLVSVALAATMAGERVIGVRDGARAAARTEAAAFARSLARSRGNTRRAAALAVTEAALARVEVLDGGGTVRLAATAKPAPSPHGAARLARALGAPFLADATFSATAPVAGAAGLRARVLLRRGPWEQRAGRGIAIAIAMLAAAWTLCVLLTLAVTAPLTARLRRVTRQIARLARGEPIVPLPMRGRSEVARLEADVNRLGYTLRRTRERLDYEVTEATAALQTSLAELEAKNAELDLARRRALDAGTTKNELLGMLGHELRNPLNAILGYTRLLGNEPLSASQVQALNTIAGAARTLTQLLDGMLNLARVDSGLVHTERKPFDLVAVIDETLTLYAPRAYGKKLELIADCGARRSLPVVGDPLRIQQVLSNLIGNAIKYTSRGRVSVHLEARELSRSRLLARLRVCDTGPGIPRESRALVFDRFRRLDATSDAPGAGLGLAISKKLVEAMNGHIELGAAKGGGSEFTVNLPLARSPVEAPEGPDLQARFLLWDPDPVVREALANRLRAAGVTVKVAADRDALMQEIESERIDAAVLGLAPGEAFAAPISATRRLLALTCSLGADGPPGVAVAPKCLGQQRLEAWLASREEGGTEADTAAVLSPRLWRMLCEDTPTDLGRVGRALRENRIDDARAAVHRIRGTAAFVRMRASERVARQLEEALAGETPDRRAGWDELARLGRTLLTELRRMAPPVTRRLLKDWRILVVDDNRLNGELLARHLESHGAAVEHCLSAEQAHRTKGPWDAILVDVQLGATDGIHAGKRLRRRFRDAILVAQSADAQPLTRRRAKAAGFRDYFTKPLDLDALPERLRQLRGDAGPVSEQQTA